MMDSLRLKGRREENQKITPANNTCEEPASLEGWEEIAPKNTPNHVATGAAMENLSGGANEERRSVGSAT